MEGDLFVFGGLYGGIRIHVDCGIEYSPPVKVGIRRHITAPPGETKPQWCFASDDHNLVSNSG